MKDSRRTKTQHAGKLGVLILGLGNSILRDDGVGVHAVRCFQRLNPAPCPAIEVGTSIFDAVPFIESADRVLAFDAVEGGGKPGSVYLLRAEDISEEVRYASIHEMGIQRILQTLRRAPAEVVIVGAEPQVIDWGTELSPALELAVPIMVSTALKVISKWECRESGIRQIDLASIISADNAAPTRFPYRVNPRNVSDN